MNKQLFWDELERAYATIDNREFDRQRNERERRDRRDRLTVALALIGATLAVSFVYGLFILNII
jgi:hypothetical protein